MFLVSFFLRFLMDLRASVPSKTFKMLHRGSIFHVFASSTSRKFPTCFCQRFCIDFSSIFAPKSLQKSIKKTIKKNTFFNRFFMIFEQIWDPILEPSWPILAPCWPSWRLLGLLLAILGAILAPRRSQGAPQSLPDPPRPQFSSIFGPFLERFSDFFSLIF